SGNSFRSESHFKLSPKYSRFIQGNIQRFDSFVARLSCSYPCCATVHVARPTRSILDFARNDNWMQRHVARRNRGGSFRETFRDLTRSSPDSLAAALAAQPSMSVAPLAG